MASGGESSFPVVIVGGGPVGMVLAMSLAAFGVRSVVVNIETDSRWRPKGSTHNARTMEHYRRLGLTPAIRRVGMPADHPTDVGYFTALNGWELARLPMPSEAEKMRRVRDADVTDQTPEPLFRCNQMYVERELHAHLKTVGGVEMRFGWRCIGFAEHGGGVTVEIENVATGARETLAGTYLVGCDGGHSVVRRALGIRYGGEVLAPQAYGTGATISTHLRAPALYDRILRQQMLAALDRQRGGALAAHDARRRKRVPVQHALPLGRRPARRQFHRRRVPGHGRRGNPRSNSSPTGRGSRATRWSPIRFGVGRVLLAGDAVHLFTPTGGFGMNTGIDDACNLAWKLAALVQGWGGPNLIASYEIERRPIAVRNTGHSKRLAKNVGDVPSAAQMGEDTAEGAAARRAAGDFLATFGEEFASLGVQLGARYDGSPIVIADGTAAPRDDPAVYVPSACPGGRAPHVWLPDRTSLYDHLGRYFTLLRLKGCRDDGAALAAAARRRKIPLAIYDVALPEARDLYAADMALIRPDLHVAWRGNRLPDDADAMLARVTGWP